MCTGVRGMYLGQKCIWVELWVEAIFIYIDSYFVYLFFFLALSWNLVALQPQLYMFCTLFFFSLSLSVCPFSSRRLAVHAAIYKYSSPTTFRCQRLQNLSQILQCQMPCTYSMNNVKPQRLFSFLDQCLSGFWFVFFPALPEWDGWNQD